MLGQNDKIQKLNCPCLSATSLTLPCGPWFENHCTKKCLIHLFYYFFSNTRLTRGKKKVKDFGADETITLNVTHVMLCL